MGSHAPVLWLVGFLSLVSACAPRIVRPDPDLYAVSDGLRVIRGGHATVWLDLAGFRVLTDPMFSNWLGPFHRRDALGLDPQALPPVDVIVVSHSHMDHFDPASIRRVPGPIAVLFPPESAVYHPWVKPHVAREVAWWKSVEVTNRTGIRARITAVPAAHWGGYLGFDGLWNDTFGGWVIQAQGYTVYFAGDTGMDAELFTEIRRRFQRLDLALLPIGPVIDRSPSNRMTKRHINPPQALEAFILLGADTFIPMHYGAFWQGPFRIDEPLDWMQELLATRRQDDRIAILEPGVVAVVQRDATGVARVKASLKLAGFATDADSLKD